ncbi:protein STRICTOSIDINE SYNTHASE-LIKE 12-like [Mercurialis annua]|uniref:protein STRICTOSIDINE SYNTHASE-LIKE 12-like n=1 Tax=Mercurialis annua TaxID=3986 RepID=UPI0024AD52A4|nr:protein STRICTOSIDINE SYNTHASE-LIKE 12-like [Mercurialis annua]
MQYQYDRLLKICEVSLIFMASMSLIFIFLLHVHIAMAHPRASFERLYLPTPLVGPESLAFDWNGGGPYTGASDGRILKYQGPNLNFTEFAYTTQNRNRSQCDGATDPSLQSVCGRPLGIAFYYRTGELYIADANNGLFVVGPNGGQATPLLNSVQGVPLKFLAGLDVDQTTGNSGFEYFCDYLIILFLLNNYGHSICYILIVRHSFFNKKKEVNIDKILPMCSADCNIDIKLVNIKISTHSSREKSSNCSYTSIRSCRDIVGLVQSRDNTGSLFMYDPRTKQATVLLRNLSAAAGTAVSRDGSFVLVNEFLANRIQKYWLRGPRANTAQILRSFPGKPDNIKKNANGHFWVAVSVLRDPPPPKPRMLPLGYRFNENGLVLQVVSFRGPYETEAISEVQEMNGTLYAGSLHVNFAATMFRR